MTLPRQIDAIVEDQVKRWLASQPGTRAKPEEHRPIVTVSRQFAARGGRLARLIADALGFALWDRELVAELARQTHAPLGAMSALDEHRKNPLEPIVSMAIETPVRTADYRHALDRAIAEIAEHGAAVVVGRGATYQVPAEAALRLRVVCPLDARVRELALRRGLGLAAARVELDEVEADRRIFLREQYGRDADEPTDVDVIVNTGVLTLEQARDVAVAAYRARFGRP